VLGIRLDGLGFTVFAGCLQPTGPDAVLLSRETSDRCTILSVDVTSQESLDEAKKTVEGLLAVSGQSEWTRIKLPTEIKN
jgi:hypothetical protein